MHTTAHCKKSCAEYVPSCCLLTSGDRWLALQYHVGGIVPTYICRTSHSIEDDDKAADDVAYLSSRCASLCAELEATLNTVSWLSAGPV